MESLLGVILVVLFLGGVYYMRVVRKRK